MKMHASPLDNIRLAGDSLSAAHHDTSELFMLRYGRYLRGASEIDIDEPESPILREAVRLECGVDAGPVEADYDVAAQVDDRDSPLA